MAWGPKEIEIAHFLLTLATKMEYEKEKPKYRFVKTIDLNKFNY
jgi:hypothetical protein